MTNKEKIKKLKQDLETWIKNNKDKDLHLLDVNKLLNIVDCYKQEEIKQELKLAKQCLNHKGCYCNNKDCKNKYCPLNENGKDKQ